jgi:hypothetical protein
MWTPQKIMAPTIDWRFVNELRKELKGSLLPQRRATWSSREYHGPRGLRGRREAIVRTAMITSARRPGAQAVRRCSAGRRAWAVADVKNVTRRPTSRT